MILSIEGQVVIREVPQIRRAGNEAGISRSDVVGHAGIVQNPGKRSEQKICVVQIGGADSGQVRGEQEIARLIRRRGPDVVFGHDTRVIVGAHVHALEEVAKFKRVPAMHPACVIHVRPGARVAALSQDRRVHSRIRARIDHAADQVRRKRPIVAKGRGREGEAGAQLVRERPIGAPAPGDGSKFPSIIILKRRYRLVADSHIRPVYDISIPGESAGEGVLAREKIVQLAGGVVAVAIVAHEVVVASSVEEVPWQTVSDAEIVNFIGPGHLRQYIRHQRIRLQADDIQNIGLLLIAVNVAVGENAVPGVLRRNGRIFRRLIAKAVRFVICIEI